MVNKSREDFRPPTCLVFYPRMLEACLNKVEVVLVIHEDELCKMLPCHLFFFIFIVSASIYNKYTRNK